MMDVTTAPAAAPVNRLVVSFARIFRSPSPAIRFKASAIWSMPKRNKANPPSSPIRIGPISRVVVDIISAAAIYTLVKLNEITSKGNPTSESDHSTTDADLPSFGACEN